MMFDLAHSSPPKNKNTNTYHYSGQKIGPLPIKTHPYSILPVPTTQLAKMSIDLEFVELTADVLEVFFIKYINVDAFTAGNPFLGQNHLEFVYGGKSLGNQHMEPWIPGL